MSVKDIAPTFQHDPQTTRSGNSLALSVIVAMTNLRFRQNSEKRRRLQASANAVRWRAGCGPRLHGHSRLEALRRPW